MIELKLDEVFKRASTIATERYPNGCPDADILADIVREILAEAQEKWEGPPYEYGVTWGPNAAPTPPANPEGYPEIGDEYLDAMQARVDAEKPEGFKLTPIPANPEASELVERFQELRNVAMNGGPAGKRIERVAAVTELLNELPALFDRIEQDAAVMRGLVEQAAQVAEQVAGGFIIFSEDEVPYIDKRTALAIAKAIRSLAAAKQGARE